MPARSKAEFPPEIVVRQGRSPEETIKHLRAWLERPELPAELSSTDPLLEARLRGLAVKTRLLEQEGGSVGVEEVGTLLGLSRQGVDKRRKQHQLLGVNAGRRGYRYPVWQFVDGAPLPGLRDVLAQLADHSPWVQINFLLTGDPRLGGQRPVDALRRGHTREVVEAAANFLEPGA